MDENTEEDEASDQDFDNHDSNMDGTPIESDNSDPMFDDHIDNDDFFDKDPQVEIKKPNPDATKDDGDFDGLYDEVSDDHRENTHHKFTPSQRKASVSKPSNDHYFDEGDPQRKKLLQGDDHLLRDQVHYRTVPYRSRGLLSIADAEETSHMFEDEDDVLLPVNSDYEFDESEDSPELEVMGRSASKTTGKNYARLLKKLEKKLIKYQRKSSKLGTNSELSKKLADTIEDIKEMKETEDKHKKEKRKQIKDKTNKKGNFRFLAH